jgi:glucokinase
MIIGVDIGGTKTLIGVFDEAGTVTSQVRFETPKDYQEFLSAFRQNFEGLGLPEKAEFCAMAVPSSIDRKQGVAITFGNLPWKNVAVEGDIAKIVDCPTKIENDANLAGLSEALTRSPVPDKVLYVTISTGIGTGVIDEGVIDETLEDSEGGNMLLPYGGELQIWEKFGSGKAIVAAYGKPASEIDDPAIWAEIVERWWLGFVELCSVIEPDLIVIGGGVGSHFSKYGELLLSRITEKLPPIVRRPKIEQALHAEQAALLGTYYFAKQQLEK